MAAFGAVLLFALSTTLGKILVDIGGPLSMTRAVSLGISLGFGIAWLVGIGLRRLPLPWQMNWPKKTWLLLMLSAVLGNTLAPLLATHAIDMAMASRVAVLAGSESAFTALIAWVFFKERFDWNILLGIVLMAVAFYWLSPVQGVTELGLVPMLLALGSYLVWSIDTNVVTQISDRSPVMVMCLKCALSVALLYALPLPLDAAPHGPVPGWFVPAAAVFGFFGYGLSYALFIVALRHLGAAQTGVFFAVSPFISTATAIWALHEALTADFGIAILLVALAMVALIVRPIGSRVFRGAAGPDTSNG